MLKWARQMTESSVQSADIKVVEESYSTVGSITVARVLIQEFVQNTIPDVDSIKAINF